MTHQWTIARKPRRRDSRMFFKRSIAAKIFALVVFLLALTIGLSAFLLVEVGRTRQALKVVVECDIPLNGSVQRIDQLGLARRLAFERWFGALNSPAPNPRLIAEAKTDYEAFTTKLLNEFGTTRSILAAYKKQGAGREQLIEAKTLIDLFEPTYPVVTRRQRELIALQESGQREKAGQQLEFLNDTLHTMRGQRDLLDLTMSSLVTRSSLESAERHQHVVWLTAAATASTVVLGLAVAGLIVNRLTQPVRSLMTAMRDVQQGNLEVALPVKTEDEVGALTQSFNYFVGELRSKERIKRTFGKYIDQRVLEHVVLQPGAENEASARRVMTILFADLVGFTTLSERLTPTLLVTVLNRHFGLQAQAVHEHLGVVDKFLGDSIMAFWGPPFHQPTEHATYACRAACAQLAILDTLRKELPELTGLRKETPNLDLRIGLCTGDVIVGNIGSETTRAYTVIGDTVNLTSRLEGANRIYGTRVLVGETTARAAGGGFVFREVDSLAVKGKTEPTRVFELLGETGKVADTALRLGDAYGEALRDYRARNWDAAEAGFRRCLEIQPADGPAALLLQRIDALRATPLESNWDGAWQLTEK